MNIDVETLLDDIRRLTLEKSAASAQIKALQGQVSALTAKIEKPAKKPKAEAEK